MLTDYKIDILGRHDSEEEPELSTLPSKLSLDGKANAGHKILNGIHEQRKTSINNFATNAERRALSDRCEANLLVCICLLLNAFFPLSNCVVYLYVFPSLSLLSF